MGGNGLNLAEEMGKWQALVSTVMNIQVHKMLENS
jgi:hypothetical protein